LDLVFGKRTAQSLATSKQIQKDLALQKENNAKQLALIESGKKRNHK